MFCVFQTFGKFFEFAVEVNIKLLYLVSCISFYFIPSSEFNAYLIQIVFSDFFH